MWEKRDRKETVRNWRKNQKDKEAIDTEEGTHLETQETVQNDKFCFRGVLLVLKFICKIFIGSLACVRF